MIQPTPVQDPLLHQIADSVGRHGLSRVALVVLEAGRPLAFLLSQLLWLSQPALSLIVPSRRIGEMAELLERPGAIEALISCIEESLG